MNWDLARNLGQLLGLGKFLGAHVRSGCVPVAFRLRLQSNRCPQKGIILKGNFRGYVSFTEGSPGAAKGKDFRRNIIFKI